MLHSTPAGAQVLQAAHHLVKAAAPAPGQTERVVNLARTVDRDPDEEVVLLEEGRPSVVQLGAVGLDRVLRPLPRLQVVVDQLDRAAEELEPHQRRLATLPCDLHDRDACVRLDQLTDVRLQQLIGHPEATARIQHLLGEKEAVGAVEVADGAGGLREQVKSRRRIGTDPDRHRTSPRRQATVPQLTAACTSWRDRIAEQARHGASGDRSASSAGSRRIV